MKRYEEYKESGVKWIGKVSSHWNYSRIKFGLKSSFSGVWGYDEKGNQNDVVCYRVADFDYENGGLSEEKITIRNIDGNTFKEREVHPNDILIEKSGGGDVNPVGRAVIVNLAHKATCSNFIHCVRCNDNILNYRLLYYYFYSIYAQKVNLLFFNQTTGIQNLKIPDYLGQIIFLPPLAEQHAIASFLDAKTKLIDAIISKREKQIELLEEMKSAIISRAVTKGLNPNAKMKDSGIEWIGEMPEEWTLSKIKYLIYGYKAGPFGSSLITSNLLSEGNILVYTPEHIANMTANMSNNLYLPEIRKEEMSQFIVQSGDLIFPIVGSLGRAMFVSDEMPEGIINQRLAKFRLNENMIEKNFFMYYFTKCHIVKEYIDVNSRGAIIVNLTKDIVTSMDVPLPPLSEQRTIAAYLDTETSNIDARIAKRRRQIELLQEYKQALITDAVTGKIDVRGINS